MSKLLSLILSAAVFTAFVAEPVQAETTKEAWVKKKKAEANRKANEEKGMGGSNAGEARNHNRNVEEKRKAKHREIDETAKRLGDGKQNHKPKR